MIFQVVVEVNKKSLDKPFNYKAPFSMQGNIKVGSRVLIPFGNRSVEGFVLNILNENDESLKDIITLYEDYLSKEQLKLLFFLRKSNLATLIECANVLSPPAFRASHKSKIKAKTVKHLMLLEHTYTGNEKENALVNALKLTDLSLQVATEKFGTYLINKLCRKEIIKKYDKLVYRDVLSNVESKELYTNPTQHQLDVIKSIDESEKLMHLIFGPTGSGKTVCYLELIHKTLSVGKQVLLLVPEVSLTPQYLAIFKHHLKNDIAVFHSKLTSAVRNDQYKKVIDRKVNIAIGTRSSVFLPFDNLGLIILDEEHDDSYIQEQIVSYNTKEIAMFRAKFHQAKLVLGSATPSVTTFYSALADKIVLHKLENKYSDVVTDCEVVDMRSNFDYIISQVLINKIRDVLNRNQQFILLLNKRGYASYLLCKNCGRSLKCPNCSVTLKLHKNGLMKCHYCDFKSKINECSCGSVEFEEYGYGIQKVEELLSEIFPNNKFERVDYDTVESLGFLEATFEKFRSGEFDALIGTQILSKGLDFPNVVLVAIIDADYALSLSNYQASEKTFQYISQSIGRSGRGESDSSSLIQVFDVNHYSIKEAVNNNYQGFYNQEIEFRKALNYPPFCKMVKISCSSYNLSDVSNSIMKIYQTLVKSVNFISKPDFSSIELINNQYQLQLIVKLQKNTQFFVIIESVRNIEIDEKVNLIVTSNPLSF